MKNVKESANFILSIADLLRGDYKQSDYGKVIGTLEDDYKNLLTFRGTKDLPLT
jgi:hypothetical protein